MEKAEIETGEQEHRDFLLEVAKKVSTWIINEKIRVRFQKQAKAFYEDIVKWVEHNEQTPSPLVYLELPYATHSDAHIGRLIDDDKPKRLSTPFDKEKSLRANYVLLTIIHEKRLKSPRTPLISDGIWPKDEEWVESKWREINKGRIYESRDIQTHIELALKRVEADLWPENPAETKQNHKTTIVAIIISLFIICIFVLSVRFIPFTLFTWLKNHPNSYGLQGSIICLIACFILGLYKPKWRKLCWGGALIAFLGVLLSLLGGPADSNVN